MANESITIASQRNLVDAATELTVAYIKDSGFSKEEVAEIYKTFYKAALEAWNQEF